MVMGYLGDEIQDAALKLGFSIEQLSVGQAEELRSRLAGLYGRDPAYFSYQNLKEYESIHDSTAWSWVSEFIGNSEVYLFFLKDQDPSVWKVPNGEMIVPLLEESIGFVFYIVPPNAEYILCYEDHDCLIGAGTAMEWIRHLSDQRGK
jgi:hypothetical protein